MRFACCHLVTLGACVLLRKVSVGKSFEWKTSDACGKTCNVPCVVPDSICLLKTEKTGRYLYNLEFSWFPSRKLQLRLFGTRMTSAE